MLPGSFKTKDLNQLLAAADQPHTALKRSLGAFNVTMLDVGEGACWVYGDHMILDNFARTRDGNLVFQIPQTVDRVLPDAVLCG